MKGQALVEFAVSLVIILILLSGAVELGIGLFQYIQLRDAAQEGALFGSVCPDRHDLIEQRARNSSNSPLDLTDEALVDVNIEETDDEGVRVTMSHRHRVFMPFASLFAGEYINIEVFVVDTILTRENCK